MKILPLSENARRPSLLTEISPSSEQRDSLSFTTRRTIVRGSSSASAILFFYLELGIGMNLGYDFVVIPLFPPLSIPLYYNSY